MYEYVAHRNIIGALTCLSEQRKLKLRELNFAETELAMCECFGTAAARSTILSQAPPRAVSKLE
jgi:hypothetical protein